ncbi:MAG: radical SAM protein [Fervidobacterium sp.]
MRRPANKTLFNEFQYVKKFRDSEIELENITGNLPEVAFIFPDNYKIASSSLAWSWIQRLLSLNKVSIHRFFYENWFRKFYSLEKQTPIDEYPIWMFTIQFENNLINIADMLVKKNIPLKSTERTAHHPLIIIGGPVTFFNHHLLEEIADFVFIGDLEPEAEQFADAILEYIRTKNPESFRRIGGIYSLKYKKTHYRKYNGTLSPVPHSHYITPYSTFPNKLLIEIGRGCIWRCAFCVTGYTKKPVKFAEIDEVKHIIEKYHEKEFGFISATITDYPYLSNLLEYIKNKDIKFSVSSLRVDKLDKNLVYLLRKSNQQSFTLAPEGISQKLRNAMLKDIDTESIFNALRIGIEVGFESVKLYYIVGLGEDESDYIEFFEFLQEVQRLGYKQIALSINPLVPKPKTPFEKKKIVDKKTYDEIVKRIRKNLPRNIKANFESYKEAQLQYELAHLKGAQTVDFLKRYLKLYYSNLS